MFNNFRFDWLSYSLGIFSGVLSWFIISRLKVWIPGLLKIIQHQMDELKHRRLSGAETAIRQSTIRRAQSAHLVSPLFRLDEILIPPQLIAPPIQVEPGSPLPPESVADQIIPYLPFWPEFIAPLYPHRLTLQQALASNINLIIVGEPGSGKTVTLAYLATLVARQDPSLTEQAALLPIYLDARELGFSDSVENSVLSTLTDSVSKIIPRNVQTQVPALLQSSLMNGSLLLILDGLDELHPEKELPQISKFLSDLQNQYPGVRIVLAASPYHLNGLIKPGVHPFVLAPWSLSQKNAFLDRWTAIWNEKIKSGNKAKVAPDMDVRLVQSWIRNLPSNLNPLEYTLRLWSAFSGDLQQGAISYAGLETYLTRSIPSEAGRLAVEKLAAGMILAQKSALPDAQVEEILDQALKTNNQPPSSEPGSTNKPSQPRPGKTISIGERKSSGGRLLDELSSNGILIVSETGLVRFTSIQVEGYLASFALPADLPRELFDSIHWPGNSETLHYITTQGGQDLWLDTILRLEDAPLYWLRFMICRWLKDAPSSALWKSPFMRDLLTLIHKENLPLSIRAGLFAGLLSSGDPSLGSVVKQLLASPNPVIRRLSALAAGILNANGLINALLDLLPDPNQEVGLSAILALGAFESSQAVEICGEILMNASESQRQAAAEALSQTEKGQAILQQALLSDDLLTRRAAVHGISMLRTTQTRQMLEKISVEDGQWIVRSAGAEALEWMQRPDPHIPPRLVVPAETPWIISYASKSGTVLTKKQPALPILLDAVKNGAPEERMRAIDYLSLEQDEGVIATLYHLVYSPSEPLSRAALNTLWLIAANGAHMPSQTKFGLG